MHAYQHQRQLHSQHKKTFTKQRQYKYMISNTKQTKNDNKYTDSKKTAMQMN